MSDMSKHHRWKRRGPTDAEKAISQAPHEEPVHLDVERLQRSLQSPSYVMPSGLTPEERRQFIIAVANGHR